MVSNPERIYNSFLTNFPAKAKQTAVRVIMRAKIENVGSNK